MASTRNRVSANKGMSVKNEHDAAEINAMALKMKENYQKTATAAAKQQPASPANVNINRAARAVTLADAPITTDNSQTNQDKLPKDCEDVESIKGRFSWKLIAGYYVPYIIRVINGEQFKFVSVRMAETQLLKNYLHYLHADIYTCTNVRSLFVTESEAKVLNDINKKHTDCMYGKEVFLAGKDYIVSLEDVLEFYTFMEVCYKKLLCKITPGLVEKCGYIRINSDSVVPYCIKDNQKYVPLFYFEGKTENLREQTLKLENWNLAYLKFCCKVQGIKNELFTSDSCKVTSLEVIKNNYPSETNFEDYWPANLVDIHLLNNQKSTHVNPPGVWIRAPPGVVPAENTIAHTLKASAPLPPSMPIMVNTYQNGRPANQMVNSSSTHAQPPSTSASSITARNQSIAAQRYNAVNSSSTHAQPPSTSASSITARNQSIAAQRYNAVNSSSTHAQPPSTSAYSITARNQSIAAQRYNAVNSSSTHAQLPSTSVYSITARNQSIAAQRYNAGSTMSLGSSLVNSVGHVVPPPPLVSAGNTTPIIGQMSLFYIQSSNKSQDQQQQIITTPQTQQSNSGKSVHARLTNTQQRNALRNAGPVAIAPSIEIIDLLSPPSSPVPPDVQENSLRPNISWECTRIPERKWAHDTANNSAYKIQRATLRGIVINCINAKPYIYSDLMVTLKDLVRMMLPSCTVERCAYTLNKCYKTTIFTGNSEQLALLRKNGLLGSKYPAETPMAMLRDVTHALPQLMTIVSKQNEQIKQRQAGAACGPAKIQRTS